MKKCFVVITMLFGLVLITSPSYAVIDTPENRLQIKLNALKTMTANFKQVVRAEGREISSSRGNMALKRPGRFRWDTKSPMAQLVIADGNKMWIYDIELEQVTVKKQEKGIGGTPGLFLSGYDDTVSRDFVVKEKMLNKHRTRYDMKAKSKKENYQRVKMTFNDSKLVELVFFDQLGQITTVNLSSIKNNPKISAKPFQFKPPKGVDIIKQ